MSNKLGWICPLCQPPNTYCTNKSTGWISKTRPVEKGSIIFQNLQVITDMHPRSITTWKNGYFLTESMNLWICILLQAPAKSGATSTRFLKLRSWDVSILFMYNLMLVYNPLMFLKGRSSLGSPSFNSSNLIILIGINMASTSWGW